MSRRLAIIGAGIGVGWFLLALTGCAPAAENGPAVFQATIAPVSPNAPVYTATPTLTPTPTLTATLTLTPTDTLTATPTLTLTPTFTPSLTLTFTPAPTLPLVTLTAPASPETTGSIPNPAAFTAADGWSCVEYPCADDLTGWQERLQVPDGYTLEFVGRLPGQPLQITYGGDGRLYATVLESGTLTGAVYALNPDGSSERYSQDTFFAPFGLAFQPGTDVLYVSARLTPESGGGLWRVLPDGSAEPVLDELPCCLAVVGNQPNGLVFGPDGYLYLGVGSLTDHAEPANPQREKFATLGPLEAAVLRIQPHTGEVEAWAQGIRNPIDLSFDSAGQFYASDNGLLDGVGDRLLTVEAGGHYGFPFWRNRGCVDCPLTDFSLTILPDLLALPDYTLPRGLTVYTGQQFPAAVFDDLFVALWNRGMVVWIDPERIPTNPDALALYRPQPFITGLMRPADVIVAPDGSLVVADFIYGQVWRVRYADAAVPRVPSNATTAPTRPGAAVFVTSTPRP